MIANRTLDGVAFIPPVVTLVVQILAFVFVRGMIVRASRRLDRARFSVDQRGFALQVMQEFALAAQLFTGGLAVLFALQLTAAVSAAPGRGLAIGIAAGTVAIYAMLALVAPFWDRLYAPIAEHPELRLPWYDRLVQLLRMREYGTLLTWGVIVVTFAAQALTAFLGLPVASATVEPAG